MPFLSIDMLTVMIEDPGPVLDSQSVNLTCTVNLPRAELINQNVLWAKDGETPIPGIPENPDMGIYKLLLTNAQPNVTSGVYTCTASTVIQTGGNKTDSDVYTLDVKGKE